MSRRVNEQICQSAASEEFNAEEAEAERLAKINRILEKAPKEVESSVQLGKGASIKHFGKVAVCGSERGGCGRQLLSMLESVSTSTAKPVWIDLDTAAKFGFEEMEVLLEGCRTLIVCPNSSDLSKDIERSRDGLKAVLASAALEMNRVVLLSRIGAQTGKGGFNISSFFSSSNDVAWSDLEDELTSTARKRNGGSPMWPLIIRVGTPVEKAVGSRVSVLPADAPAGGNTSEATAAAAIFNAMGYSVDSNFCVVDEACAPSSPSTPWDEQLLPFIGPELWRTEGFDPKRAVFFVQGWAQEFCAQGKGSARLGVKTPVQYRETPAGAIFKFRPLGTDSVTQFDDLEEGGIDISVELPPSGVPRLRIKRCAYGWKVVVKENSEKAMLEKFMKDFKETF